MLENPTDQILLLSHHPADASFLAEVAVSQQAGLELAVNEEDLISKIATFRKNGSLAAVFVDVSSVEQLRKFEFELQSKLGSGPALEVAKMVHFISGQPLFSHREIMQSPYFSSYLERKPFNFHSSVQFYEKSFTNLEEHLSQAKMSFDSGSRDQCMDWLKKEMLDKGCSIEWTLKFLKGLDEVIDSAIPARFEVSTSFENNVLKFVMTAKDLLDREKFRADRVLEMGVSALFSAKGIVLFVPVFLQSTDFQKAFRFYKVVS